MDRCGLWTDLQDRRGLWTDLCAGQMRSMDRPLATDRRGLWTDLWQRTDRGTPNLIDHEVHQEVDLTVAMAELTMASRP